MKNQIILFLSILMTFAVLKSLTAQEKVKINWLSFEQAVELNTKNPKKIFIDVYTDWCSWCKVMDNNTFTNPIIADYLNKNYYTVKLNAEMKDTVKFNNTVFINPAPIAQRGTHQLAASLLQGNMSYPAYVFLNESFQKLTDVRGYIKSKEFEPMIKFFGDNAFQTQTWETYSKSFKGEIVE